MVHVFTIAMQHKRVGEIVCVVEEQYSDIAESVSALLYMCQC